jgi:SEC-C motif domain protein
MDAERCPCQSGLDYAECCGPAHRGERAPSTAEALMRSRYSAYATGEADYLLDTWDSATRPRELTLVQGRRWVGLEILGKTGGGLGETTATVEFAAHWRDAAEPGENSGRRGVQRENSRFQRDGQRWFYTGPVR